MKMYDIFLFSWFSLSLKTGDSLFTVFKTPNVFWHALTVTDKLIQLGKLFLNLRWAYKKNIITHTIRDESTFYTDFYFSFSLFFVWIFFLSAWKCHVCLVSRTFHTDVWKIHTLMHIKFESARTRFSKVQG